MARFADDFAAVIDAVAPGQPVHVLAHDWGSVGMWEYLRRPGASDRVASFTSVSGPERRSPRPLHPSTASSARIGRDRFSARPRSGAAVRLHGSVLGPGARAAGRADGPCAASPAPAALAATAFPPHQIHHSDDVQIRRRQQPEDLPRPTLFGPPRDVAGDHYVDVPVQLIVNTRDPYRADRTVYDDTPQWVPRLWRRDIRAGHWAPMSHPQVLAQSVPEFVDFLGWQAAEPGAAARAGRPSARTTSATPWFR